MTQERIGIMGAMNNEVSELRNLLELESTEIIGSREYHLGTLQGVSVVLVFSRWGKVASSSTASTLITKFGVKKIIFTGVAGGVAKQVNIGDVIISEKLYQHDMDARPLFSLHTIPLTERSFFEPCPELKALAEQSAQDCLNSHEFKKTFQNFGILNPKVISGIIASGDQFINSSEKAQQLLEDQNALSAVEMEGAAVAQVCAEHDTPFIIIRIVSDKADEKAQINFMDFIESLASQYAAACVTRMLQHFCVLKN